MTLLPVARRTAWILATAASLAFFSACAADPTEEDPTVDGGLADTGGGGDDLDSGGTASDVGGGGEDGGGGSDTGEGCVDTDGDGFGPGCSAGADCQPDDGTSYPGAEERCGDGLDNNCDGTVDEGCPCTNGQARDCYDGPDGTSDVGACRSGLSFCEDGTWGECTGSVTPGDEICDRLDNDCDGVVDEEVANACGLCGPVGEEICDDGLDNDCNGVIDDIEAGCACGGRLDQPCYSGPPHTLGIGECVGGEMDCIEGAWGTCEGEVVPAAEVCDGLDNDCDGQVDEGLRNSCGDCADEDPIEVCDGEDNDCDGLIDEGVRGSCGLCPDEIGEEICGDSLDNDCDGDVDEACACDGDTACYPGPPETRGVGACSDGEFTCDSSGEFWESCTGATVPSVEICDGVDNDCDGEVDISPEGCSVCGTDFEVCDGIDNDCDGEIDEGLRNPCGQCFDEVVPEETLGSEYCDGLDNDCDGLIDEGLLTECGTCDDDCGECDFFVPGWSDEERCGDGQDNDNDGLADEDCPCDFGTTQPCFLGPPNSRRIGACLDGQQTCTNRDMPRWGECEGGILPSEEICDGKDNDCNGCVDEGTCDVELFCPVEDFVTPLRDYVLDGTAIFDGEADSWRWTVEPPTNSATPGPERPNDATTQFFVDVSGQYLVTVEITIDGETFTCSWILNAVGNGLRVELVWDQFGEVDLDLHLHESGNTDEFCSDADCYYVNCDRGDTPPWGYPDSGADACPGGAVSCGNPRLDIDNISGFDPENINIDNPGDGESFRIMVHNYSRNGVAETHPIVTIYCGGLQAARLGEAPDEVPLTDSGSSCGGDTWRVADVTMFTGEGGIGHTCDVDVLSGGRDGWDVRNDDDSF